jgi:endonuclease III
VTEAEPTQKFAALLGAVLAEHAEGDPAAAGDRRPADADSVMEEFLRSFLTWEASPAKAEAALKRLHHSVVDFNELRVCLTDELAQMLGERYPLARERAHRLRAALNELYRREHGVTLEAVLTMPKREARAYLASLEGVPPFVAARTTLLELGGHAFPVDERIRAALQEEGIDAGDVESLGSWLERQVRGGEARSAYLAIEAWLERRAGARRALAEEKSGRKSKRA